MRVTTSRLRVLRRRNFRQLYLGQSVSVIGDGLLPVALTFAVLDLTGSASDLGIVLAAQSLPLVALALVGGVWGDRLRRQWVMLVSDLVRAVVLAVLAALLIGGTAKLWHLIVLLALYGAAAAFSRPAAGGLLPQLVEREELQEANALVGISENFGWLVGPAVAGTLIAVLSPGGAVAIDAATFVVSAAFLATLRVPALVRTSPRARFTRELGDGWREVRSRRWLWVMLLRTCLVLFVVIAPFQVLGPLVLRQRPHAAANWGIVMAAFSAGMIVGGAVALRYRPRRPMVVVAVTGTGAVFSPMVLALGGNVALLCASEVYHGLAVGVLVAVWNTTLQTYVPVESLARVTAWDWTASMALWPAGLALAGPVTGLVGVTTACWLSGTLGIACSLWVLAVPAVRQLRPAAVAAGSLPPREPRLVRSID
jgi:MFS family permease